MGLDFFINNQAQRVRQYMPQPLLLDSDLQTDADEKPNLDYEEHHDFWHVRDLSSLMVPGDWPWAPVHFIDGKDVGRTVAWLQTRLGYPIPVRLAEIGAVVMEKKQRQLQRRFDLVERVVSFAVNPFPWDEVESFAISLREQGMRLLPCQPNALTYSFEEMRRSAQNRTKDEMERLERQALALYHDQPVLVDGRLSARVAAFDTNSAPVVGMIKKHSRNYLHAGGWQLLYEMEAGQRTPAFLIEVKSVEFVSWYVRFSGQYGEIPDYGIVRLEIARQFFEKVMKKDWSYLNILSRSIYDYRCRDASYGRAPVSIHPIQRAEESLGSLFTPTESFVQHFYHLTNL
jgi:hypothetical protein